MSKAEKQAGFQPFGELLTEGARTLAEVGIENSRRESRLLMARALNKTLEQLLLISSQELVPRDNFLELLGRRAQREPMAFITGEQGFWTLDLAVSPATLIPRADSETVIVSLQDALPDTQQALSILDLGTGSGCLLLAALSEYPQAWGVGVDINPSAVCLARQNAVRCGLSTRASFFAGQWDKALVGHKFDVVLSNPPYIPTADLEELMPEVRRFEPIAALDGGGDGMDAYRFLCGRLSTLLAPDGVAIFEIGVNQEVDLKRVAHNAGVEISGVRKDFGGIPRAVVLRSRSVECA